MDITWPAAVIAIALLAFIGCVLCFLLREKRIDSENTIRFSCIGLIVLIIVIVAFIPIANHDVVSGLLTLAGTALGYIIRDVTKKP